MALVISLAMQASQDTLPRCVLLLAATLATCSCDRSRPAGAGVEELRGSAGPVSTTTTSDLASGDDEDRPGDDEIRGQLDRLRASGKTFEPSRFSVEIDPPEGAPVNADLPEGRYLFSSHIAVEGQRSAFEDRSVCRVERDGETLLLRPDRDPRGVIRCTLRSGRLQGQSDDRSVGLTLEGQMTGSGTAVGRITSVEDWKILDGRWSLQPLDASGI